MKLIYDNKINVKLWDRIMFLIYGEIRLRLWKDKNETIKFCIQTKKWNGKWDGQ